MKASGPVGCFNFNKTRWLFNSDFANGPTNKTKRSAFLGFFIALKPSICHNNLFDVQRQDSRLKIHHHICIKFILECINWVWFYRADHYYQSTYMQGSVRAACGRARTWFARVKRWPSKRDGGRRRSTQSGNPVISPRLLSPPFFESFSALQCKIPRSISHKAKQARFKCNIPLYLSHKPKQASFKYNIPRSKVGG